MIDDQHAKTEGEQAQSPRLRHGVEGDVVDEGGDGLRGDSSLYDREADLDKPAIRTRPLPL